MLMIPEAQAIEHAKQWLAEMKTSLEGRTATVKRLQQEVYVVVFPPPAGMRAGKFTVRIDAQTGKVLDGEIER